MRSVITQIFIIFLLFSLTSCENNKDAPVKLRVVSLQGKAKPVDIKTPDLNIKALKEQGGSYSRSHYVETAPINNRANSQEYYNNSFYENKYNAPSSQKINTSEQEVVYRNEFNNDAATSSQNVRYILDSKKSNQDENPIIVQNNSNAPKINKTIEFDLSDAKSESTRKEKKPVKKQVEKINSSGYFVQVGAFKSKKNADKSLNYMRKFHNGVVKNNVATSGIKYKVILGPFAKRSSAQTLYNTIKKSGHDALIIKTRY
ncbi:MAG: SPOR domain-containing protein [Rickettsiales bacterium]|nr:SPOR domain-containing protein [Rickettsiales bacterium]